MSKLALVIVIVVVVVIVAGGGYWLYQSRTSEGEETPEASKECVNDQDCVLFGESGDCNCGCYNKDYLPSSTGGDCFCLLPASCACVDGQCEGVFE